MNVIKTSDIENMFEKAQKELSFLKSLLKEPYPQEIAVQIAEKEGIIFALTSLMRHVTEVSTVEKPTKQ